VIDFHTELLPASASAIAAKSADADSQAASFRKTSHDPAGHVPNPVPPLPGIATYDETSAAVNNGEPDAVFADKDRTGPHGRGIRRRDDIVGEDVPLGDGIALPARKATQS